MNHRVLLSKKTTLDVKFAIWTKILQGKIFYFQHFNQINIFETKIILTHPRKALIFFLTLQLSY